MKFNFLVSSFLQVCLACLPHIVGSKLQTEDGGWSVDPSLDEGPCNIDVLESSAISYGQFMHRYAYSGPVIIRGLTDNSEFRRWTSRNRLLKDFGDLRVRLSTANTFSYRKVDVPFREHVSELLRPQTPDALGSDTLYFFGDNNYTEWNSLFQLYRKPPYVLPNTSAALSFGIAGPGTGVPFHWHGPGYSEVVYGRKRWFLYPPDRQPDFHPNSTTLSWLMHTYPQLPVEHAPLECTIRPGEVLYFPDRWWHATLNLDTSVFISTFLG
ncbi:jmjC domain-containing protein 8 [Synchiropus picturatus]